MVNATTQCAAHGPLERAVGRLEEKVDGLDQKMDGVLEEVRAGRRATEAFISTCAGHRSDIEDDVDQQATTAKTRGDELERKLTRLSYLVLLLGLAALGQSPLVAQVLPHAWRVVLP